MEKNKVIKDKEYTFIYYGKTKAFKNLNNIKCKVCAKYIGQEYVGIKFKNGIETVAYPWELKE